jgi:hypothetical protein
MSESPEKKGRDEEREGYQREEGGTGRRNER